MSTGAILSCAKQVLSFRSECVTIGQLLPPSPWWHILVHMTPASSVPARQLWIPIPLWLHSVILSSDPIQWTSSRWMVDDWLALVSWLAAKSCSHVTVISRFFQRLTCCLLYNCMLPSSYSSYFTFVFFTHSGWVGEGGNLQRTVLAPSLAVQSLNCQSVTVSCQTSPEGIKNNPWLSCVDH